MGASVRGEYDRRMVEIRRGFELHGDGLRAIAARAALVDELVLRFWGEEQRKDAKLHRGIAIAAIGGYGRAELFPNTDVDMLFCVEKSARADAKDAIRRVSQSLWDCGLQVALTTRTPGECERFDAANPEFGLSLLDLRWIGGDEALFAKLRDGAVSKMRTKDVKGIGTALTRLTCERHAKYGNTLFHLEPNIKDSPGGLRDVHVCLWLRGLRLSQMSGRGPSAELGDAVAFLAALRCFLHYRRERDDNTLDWQAQDAAAQAKVGLNAASQSALDAAYWMRVYFRHARVVERSLLGEAEYAALQLDDIKPLHRIKISDREGFLFRDGVLHLKPTTESSGDPAHDPEIVMAAFALLADSGARLSQSSQERIADAIPQLSAHLEEGPKLLRQLSAVLTGKRAGHALRVMHMVGVLDLILPEFHGIDALVIRDAYHRYTVDEHTFVLLDVLHGLEEDPGNKAPEWRIKFGAMIRELQQPGLLYLAGLLHDTGKGRTGEHHAAESARMARGVLARLEMDAYDTGLVMHLIENHLEMSAAMRRDIFDAETVRAFVGKVQTHEALRVLTLFTYADIAAVHPDALTPWKVENLWRLWMAATNQLDRSVDEERVRAKVTGGAIGGWRKDEKIARVMSLARDRQAEVEQFLEGFPERYVRTRAPETMLQHFEMTLKFPSEPFQIAFHQGTATSGLAVHEITLVTQDRPRLFAGMAAALAAWGMNVVTADAFANELGVVVDSFRFTDTFRTLELNESERVRFVESVRDLVAGRASVEKLLSGRKRAKRRPPRVQVETKIDFDDTASTHSTLLQVIAQDVPGLLRAISATVSEQGYSVEVALVDTEGETAIDVFYLTSDGNRLTATQEMSLKQALQAAIDENAA
jgi:[protein-PII] uridylyltransferase